MYKVNQKGEYTPFHGWTVISNLNNNLNFIENYLKNSILAKYFSPLPASSYHMTLYNIWCNGRNLLPQQKQYLKEHKEENLSEKCIIQLLEQLQTEIDIHLWNPLKLHNYSIVYSGSTLAILFNTDDNFTEANKIRNIMTDIVGIEDGMDCYHITLCYQYADICKEDVVSLAKEIKILNKMLNGHILELNKPFVAKFQDMTEFLPCFELSRRCLGFLVPDKNTQQILHKYGFGFGFDLSEPSSFLKKNPSPFEENTTFGNAHVNIFCCRLYNDNYIKILKQIAKEIKQEQKWKLPKSAYIRNEEYRSIICFNCPLLTRASVKAKQLGWPKVIENNYELVLYPSSLEHCLTQKQEKDMLDCLNKATWGFILSIDNGNKYFQYDWNTFVPI